MKERTIVPGLLDCQADENITLIVGLVAAVHHQPHDYLGVCGCGVAAATLLSGKEHREIRDFLTSIISSRRQCLVIIDVISTGDRRDSLF